MMRRMADRKTENHIAQDLQDVRMRGPNVPTRTIQGNMEAQWLRARMPGPTVPPAPIYTPSARSPSPSSNPSLPRHRKAHFLFSTELSIAFHHIG